MATLPWMVRGSRSGYRLAKLKRERSPACAYVQPDGLRRQVDRDEHPAAVGLPGKQRVSAERAVGPLLALAIERVDGQAVALPVVAQIVRPDCRAHGSARVGSAGRELSDVGGGPEDRQRRQEGLTGGGGSARPEVRATHPA